MVRPQKKSEALSETTKSFLHEIWIKENFGREKDIDNKYIEKGNYCEEDGIDLLTKKFGKLLLKSKKEYENDFILGHLDLETKDEVLDVKNSWDIWTFHKADGSNKDYQFQGLGYMNLTNKKKFCLCYCLCNAPEHLIVAEKRRKLYDMYGMEETPEYAEKEAEIEKNMVFDDIPETERVKIFEFEYDEKLFEQVKVKIFEARAYLNSIKSL